MDVYAVKGSGDRVLLTNVPFSSFKSDSTYPHPWVTISVDFKDVLAKLGLANTFPLSAATISTLLTTYKLGINIESDLNLTDGTTVLAADIVSQGLFGSNQFYPAMRLNWAVTDYCSYSASAWAGNYYATETSELFGGYCGTASQCTAGGYDVVLVQDGTNPNKFNVTNWYDSGISNYLILTPSVDVATQVVTVPKQTRTNGNTMEGSGTYNQCLGKMLINYTYKSAAGVVLDQFLWTLVKH